MLFCGWCRGRGVAPVNANVPMIVDFLVHLRRDKGLSVSAVKGYRSALNSVFALKGMDLADSRPISVLIKSFSKSVRPEELRPPAWDITLVLQSLTRAPYEPLRTSDERFLAQKMLFLLALALAKQIGELHSLLHHISHFRDWGEVPFTFVAGFVAKTQDPSSSAPRFEDFTVPALPNAATNCKRDCHVPCRRSGVTWTVLLHIVLDVSGCSSPQNVARRRSLRTRSPSGSRRQYLGHTSSQGDPFRIFLRELGKPVVSLRLFCSRKTSLLTRC